LKIIPLSEGAFTIDQTKKFQPFTPGEDDLQKRSRGSLLVEIQPFLVITSRDILLLDTGLGFSENGHLQIHKNLAVHGINPGDITKVLISHLHKDHAGGMALPNKLEAAFENAAYYINKQEWEFALSKESSSYIPEDFLWLKDKEQLHLIEGDGIIDGYITYRQTGAHSRFHQVFIIIENKETVFYGGDVAPQFLQLKNRFKAKYDFDGEKAMQLRQEWKEAGEKDKWTFLFYHDIKSPIIQL
jgi:glyoxylase-like metal-dependent hydrolase (beta-lactamase superfamily II)